VAARTTALGSTADEVDDFELVAFAERSLSPEIARYDVAIQFHCDAIGLHAQSLNQRGQRKRRNVELPLFPIDLQFHLLRLAQRKLPRGRPPFEVGLHQ
jgi:hypothetical protein